MKKLENNQMSRSNSLIITAIPHILCFHKGDCRYSFTSIFLKRAIDLIVSLSVVTAFLPCFAMLIILVALDGGPVFYTQRRVGQGGRTFLCWKFRTMVVNADEKLEALLATDEKARQEYATFWKLKDDPRVTRIGRLLRRYSLDELPQMLNVIKGDMSIVGPRPRSVKEMEFFRSNMPESAQSYKEVRPGLTCLWQVCGRNCLGLEAKGQLDDWYSRNWSIIGDFAIVIATFPVVIRAKGAF
jgi:lipopolysaccharide/colanic/teichoic acid biosynthesis glycosyltransferase